jgi:hypothetical protein
MTMPDTDMTIADIQRMLDSMCRAVEAVDGKTFASYFAEDGIYYDDFYGEFAGRERIAALINEWFNKYARDMRWDMIEPIYQDGRLSVRYVFSYNSRLPEANDARTMFEGVSLMKLKNGKITEYREIIACGTAFVDMNFHPERIFKIFARKADAMKAKPEVQRHLPTR